jgi:hypothetical protein
MKLICILLQLPADVLALHPEACCCMSLMLLAMCCRHSFFIKTRYRFPSFVVNKPDKGNTVYKSEEDKEILIPVYEWLVHACAGELINDELYGPDRRRRCATQMDHERLAS